MSLSIPAVPLARLWPHASEALRAGIVSTSARVLEKYGIITLLDLTDFLAQISEETGGGMALVENLNYSAERLVQVWPSRFPSLNYAQKYAHNQRLLANNVYSSRGGNAAGNDDGWNYRGRGLIQLTFRDNYAMIAKATGLDLIGHPELVSDPLYALECACAYWLHAGASKLANAGDFTGETRRINGGLINLAQRVAWKGLWASALTTANTNAPPAGPPATVAGEGSGPPAATVATAKETPPMTTSTPPAAPAAPAAPPAADIPRAVPTATMSVRIPWGDWLEQALVHDTKIIEAAASGAASLALAAIPFGSIIRMFIAPQLISQYVDMGLAALEGVVQPMGSDIAQSNVFVTTITNLILTNEAKFASYIGAELEPLIIAALAKIGIVV